MGLQGNRLVSTKTSAFQHPAAPLSVSQPQSTGRLPLLVHDEWFQKIMQSPICHLQEVATENQQKNNFSDRQNHIYPLKHPSKEVKEPASVQTE